MDNAEAARLELYKQRYETWRHLDRIRWQFFQLLVAVGSIFATVSVTFGERPEAAFYYTFSAVLLVWSMLMFQIGKGISANGLALQEYGSAIGDNKIPDVSRKDLSITHWITLFVLFLSAAMFLYALKH